MADGYVVAMTDQTIIQVLMHMMSIVVLVGFLALSIYMFILVIKLSRRGIRALDIYNSKKGDMKDDSENI